jgi:hypothetical protein
MYQLGKNTAGNLVATPEAKMWRSLVNATTWHARFRFGSSHLAAPPTWPVDDRFERRNTDEDRPGFFADAVPSKENQS